MAEQPQATAGEELKNCAHCKKPVKKRRRYYRNGKYYCTDNCYRASKASAAGKAEETPAA